MKELDKTKKDSYPGNWYLFRTNVYDARIYMCVGDRTLMCNTAYAALAYGDDPLTKSEAEDFADRICTNFRNNRAGIDGECISVHNDNGRQIWIVRMDDFAGSVEHTVILSHECLHAALSIHGMCGVSENPPFEALCYLHEAIFKKFMMFCFGRIGKLLMGQ